MELWLSEDRVNIWADFLQESQKWVLEVGLRVAKRMCAVFAAHRGRSNRGI